MNSSQVQEDIDRWSQLFNVMCDGQEPSYKGHWDLRLALTTFAKEIDGFSKRENEEARDLIEKFDQFVSSKQLTKAREMENEIFYFILKAVDK